MTEPLPPLPAGWLMSVKISEEESYVTDGGTVFLGEYFEATLLRKHTLTKASSSPGTHHTDPVEAARRALSNFHDARARQEERNTRETKAQELVNAAIAASRESRKNA